MHTHSIVFVSDCATITHHICRFISLVVVVAHSAFELIIAVYQALEIIIHLTAALTLQLLPHVLHSSTVLP
jgi:hypothetical protein